MSRTRAHVEFRRRPARVSDSKRRMIAATMLVVMIVATEQNGWCGSLNSGVATAICSGMLGQAGDDADPKKDADEAPDAAPVQNPQKLKQIFRDLFGLGGPRRGGREVGKPETTDRFSERDAIDSRAPQDLKVDQIMRAAEGAIRKKDWKSGQELVQKMLDLSEDSLHRLPDGRWQSVRQTANRMLSSAPSEVLRAYEAQYSGLSQQLLNDARRTGRISDFVHVASRFLHTPAGYEAANHLGTLHLDRGEFGLAAAWFNEIASSNSPIATNPTWRTKAALAFRQAGDADAAKNLIDRIADQSVPTGTGAVNPSDWIDSFSATLPSRNKVLLDWPQIYGTVARIGTAVGGDPLLSPLWTVPLTSSHFVKRRLNWILQDLLDQDKTPVLAAMPLVVGGRAVYRDLRGVRSVDIETGKTLWESIEGISAERIIGGLPAQQAEPSEARRLRPNPFQFDQNEQYGQSVEYHPMAGLLFRDGIYGVISSDGRQVFVIEDHGILSRSQPGMNGFWDGGMNEQQDSFGVSWKTNRLVSYDLMTGRPRWSVGGVDSQESFALPLAGSFFYGTPAVDGDELLIVAGKGDDIRLWSLDRATGTPRWSQLIAYADTKIEQDLGRRWFTAQVAADGGIIVCPTTVGWLVAVDRLRQTVLWAHRYLPPSGSSASPERDVGSQFVPQRDMNSQWSPSAPVISGSVVVYTPPEEPIVVALNLLDGRRLWERPKETWLYLAGVFGDRAVLVGNTEIEAVHATTGKTIWKVSLESAHPSGRGQAAEDHFYLPLNTGELRVLDLKTGTTVSHGYVPTTQAPLGNLAMHQGKLIALGPQGLVGFGQRQAVIAEIQRRKLRNPNDGWAILHEAEIHLLNREYSLALPLLESVRSEDLTDDEKLRHHSELAQCLASVFRADPKSHLRELESFGRIVATDDEKRLFQELTADYLVAQSKFLEAFDVLWSLNRDDDPNALIARSDDSEVSMIHSVWLSGRLQQLWDSASETEREQVNSKIQMIVSNSLATELSARRTLARLIRFHPASIRLRESLVEDWSKEGDFANSQIELLDLVGVGDRTVAARAIERLARLMEQFRLPADAAYYYAILENEYGDVSWQDGMTCGQLVQKFRAERKFPEKQPSPGAGWDDRPLQLVQGTLQQISASQEISVDSPLPFFKPFSFEVYPGEQRLALENVSNNEFEWLAPLRSSPRNQGDGYTTTEFLGHQTVAIYRDVLNMFSPVEKRLLWSKPLDGSGEGGPFWRHATRQPVLSMMSADQEAEKPLAFLQRSNYSGRLASVQPGYLCICGRRSISVLDPHTGGILWRREGLPQYAQVVGNRDFIFVVPQDRSKSEAFRAFDGKPIPIDGLGRLLENSLLMCGDQMVLLEQAARFLDQAARILQISGKTILRGYQPLTKQERWRVEYPTGTLVSVLDQSQVLVVLPDGHVERVECTTGARMSLTPIPSEDLKSRRAKSRRSDAFALMDEDHIYLIANVQDTMGMHHYGENIPSIRANGFIYAWKRTDGTRQWRQEVKQQNLVVDHFRVMPILVFVTRGWEQKGAVSYSTLSVKAIHKRTGTVLHNSKTPTVYGGFHSLDVNLSEPSVELKSYNLRMRLIPTEKNINEQ